MPPGAVENPAITPPALMALAVLVSSPGSVPRSGMRSHPGPAGLRPMAPLPVPPGNVPRSTAAVPGATATGLVRAARAGPAARTTIDAAAMPAEMLNFLCAAPTSCPFHALHPYGERGQRYV